MKLYDKHLTLNIKMRLKTTEWLRLKKPQPLGNQNLETISESGVPESTIKTERAELAVLVADIP